MPLLSALGSSRRDLLTSRACCSSCWTCAACALQMALAWASRCLACGPPVSPQCACAELCIPACMACARLRAGGGAPAQEDAQQPDSDFKPNLVNTVCWLISYVVQICTFAVNYQGEPFNIPLRLNRGLNIVVQYGAALYGILTLDIVPGLAGLFSLV